jgi:DNA-binding transcriptional LysR family regulator
MQPQERDMEYFAAIAEHGQIGRAAEFLGLSQPALSKSLRRLEGSMQAKLVKRTPKGVELTEVGMALLSQVRRLRLVREEVVREVADLSQGRVGDLRIGVHPGAVDDLVGPACSVLLKTAPKVTLAVSVETNEAAVTALRNGKLDLIVSVMPASPYEDIVQEHLVHDVMIIFASADHRLAKRKRVTLQDLAQEAWTATAFGSPAWPHVHRAFESAGLHPPQIVAQTTSLSLRDHLVASTDLLGTGSRRVMRQTARRLRLVELPVKEFTAKRSIGVGYRKDAYLSPAAKRFIEILKATAKSIAEEQA